MPRYKVVDIEITNDNNKKGVVIKRLMTIAAALVALASVLFAAIMGWSFVVSLPDVDSRFSRNKAIAPLAPERNGLAILPEPPITEFTVRSASDAATFIFSSELVLGVKVGNESRAYPINMLTGAKREILNDKLGGKAIAATW